MSADPPVEPTIGRVAVVMGSDSDLPQLEGCFEVLRSFGIPFDARVLSAHRTPAACAEFAENPGSRYSVFIAAAGGAAHLAGAIAARTTLPVIGVPLVCPPLEGLDALLATVQMPPGVPVATVAVGAWGARNAAVLACQILALSDPVLAGKLKAYKVELADKAAAKDRRLQERLEEAQEGAG
jgi:phosphoribosylaminoimidazole carboxylase PurE protein